MRRSLALILSSLCIAGNAAAQQALDDTELSEVRGAIDMFGLSFNVEKKPDGSDYLAVGLPPHIKFTDFGFESPSVQTDPAGPVTESLDRMSVNGTINMQGQLRMWVH